MLIRLCKTILVGIIAIFFTLVAINNIADYSINYTFVEHVMKMDTVFSTSQLVWRAISWREFYDIIYGIIILWQISTALLCWLATIKLFFSRKKSLRFARSQNIALAGLTLGFTLYSLGFIVIGGEWFQMWQSKVWNGQATSGIFLNMIGIVMLVLLQPSHYASSPLSERE